jgi:hypothetical protein
MTDGDPDFTSDDIAFSLHLTEPELKVTYTALKIFFDDLGHDERDVQDVARSVLGKLPGEHDVRGIDVRPEIEQRRGGSR